MNFLQFSKLLKKNKTPANFTSINFGCRVNAAETNQLSQILIDHGFSPSPKNPKIVLINTCVITKKGEGESIRKVKYYSKKYPQSNILVTGCLSSEKIKELKNVHFFDNSEKQNILTKKISYTPKIKDKFSHSHRYILKIQSGCQHFCSYCIVPFRRPNLWSLPIPEAVKIVNQAVNNGYQEIIITGTNLNLYKFDLNKLLKNLLNNTKIPLISFGSIPLNCINDEFIKLITKHHQKITKFFHIPLQSGSDKILKSMNRPYNRKKINTTFKKLKQIPKIKFGTDIIVGFPDETKKDFQQTKNLCQQIGFSKIHVFRYSLRPGTLAEKLFNKLPKIKNEEKINRSKIISQSILPSRQTPAH